MKGSYSLKSILTALALASAGCGFLGCPPSPPDIQFHAEDGVDFARLEAEMPLSVDERMAITPQNIKQLSQEQVDQIYGRLTAGPIPDGPYNGDLFFARGVYGDSRLAEILGGGLKGVVADAAIAKTQFIGRALWKGKVFYRDQMVLRNRIEDTPLLRPLLGDEPTSTIEKIEVDGGDAYLLFPAKLYCGQSLLDGRRESLIIDYAFSDDLPGYRHDPDRLAARNGLVIRDEVRMVRPGFYLGRAYTNKIFLVNFTLIKEDVVARSVEVIEGGDGESGLDGDFAHRERLHSAVRDQAARGREDPLAAGLDVGLTKGRSWVIL